MGHIINLVARMLLFGADSSALDKEEENKDEILHQILAWRNIGPVGKLRNIIFQIFNSEQRLKKLLKLQDLELASASDDSSRANTKLLPIKPVETRWNSIELAIKRAIKLQDPINRIVGDEVLKQTMYWAKVTKNGTKDPPARVRKQPDIIRNYLTGDDWATLTKYLAILKPLWIATKRLEGRLKEGKFGSLWEVLPTFEYLLDQFERFKVQYEHHPEPHFRHNINAAWLKLTEYYQLTDRSPAYITATVLNPAHKWTFADKYWTGEGQTGWKEAAEQAVRNLWLKYKYLPIKSTTNSEPLKQRRVFLSKIDDYFAGGFALPTPANDRDKYNNWLARAGHPKDV